MDSAIEDRGSRRDRAVAALRELGADRLLVTDLVNVRYLSGFTGSNGAVVLSADGAASLVTDGRYRDQAAVQSPDFDVHVAPSLLGPAAALAPAERWAVETHVLTVEQHDVLVEQLDHEPVPSGRLVEGLREVKDAGEVELLRQACAISVEALEQTWAGPLVGRTEREVAIRLERLMVDLGAEAAAFDTICAAGENSAIPHHSPTDRVLAAGDLLKIDFGARVGGYHADCTRTVVLGRAAGWQREIHAAVRQAQALGVDGLRVDATPAQIDAAVRADLDASGWLDRFTTGLGHGVGLQIHEDPFFGPARTGRLVHRTVLTMEPGVYLVGRGGVRIEDTVCVTPGHPEVLTPAPTDLLEIG
ncbi:MAG: Xaa-Pro peptidase family protein [Aeromicrobium sp.]|uniref:M24 family metallopeptidase n=1 Tax=Aeromicrobium sp. TaxID=1871063 RepID=UPI0025BB80AE|nr:Xaa-Pro peptidase family protein [Aeromicrobium sp.]MDF1705586.1 Xaa-Pro peptidase family protein [Aeromicrobium sp.]